MTRAPDMRHVKIANGARVTLLRPQRRFTDTTFTDLETIPAGTTATVQGHSNAGFDGLRYHLRLDDGRYLSNTYPQDLVAFS